MSSLPKLLDQNRIRDAVLIPMLGVVQALALGVGAFATRDAFTALHGNGSPTASNLAFLIGAGLTAAGIEVLSRQRSEALGQSYALSLRHVLYDHLAGMDRREVAARRVGALSLRFMGDLSAARGWFGCGVSRLLSAVVVPPGAAVVLYMLNPSLAAVATPPILLSLMAMLALAIGLQARHRSLRGQRANISIAMMERIAIAPDLDLLDRTDRELAALAEDGAILRRNAVARIARVGLLRMLPQAGAVLAGAAMLWVSGRAGVAPGETAAGLAVLGILMIPLREFADVWDQFCVWRVAREKALKLLARPSTRRRVVPRGHPVGVRIVGVTLGPRVIRADIPPGALVLITGPQGSGKSQLGQLIAGLDRAPDGALLYDGQPAPLPRIVHVSDRPIVIQGNLRRTLTLGIDPRPKQREIEKAARTFGLTPLMTRLEGLLGRVGEAARTTSDSEALRLDLTRAALSQPDVMNQSAKAKTLTALTWILEVQPKTYCLAPTQVRPRRFPHALSRLYTSETDPGAGIGLCLCNLSNTLKIPLAHGADIHAFHSSCSVSIGIPMTFGWIGVTIRISLPSFAGSLKAVGRDMVPASNPTRCGIHGGAYDHKIWNKALL